MAVAQGYKTIVVNGAATLLPLVDLVANNGALISTITGGNAAAALSILGLINVVLRWVTTTPVFKSEE